MNLECTSPANSAALLSNVTRLAHDQWPDIYGVKLQGECLLPIMPHGAVAVVDKIAEVKIGHIVCMWWCPEHIGKDRLPAIIKRLVHMPSGLSFPCPAAPASNIVPTVALQQFNPSHTYHVPADKIAAIHKVVGWMESRARVGGKVTLKNLRPVASE